MDEDSQRSSELFLRRSETLPIKLSHSTEPIDENCTTRTYRRAQSVPLSCVSVERRESIASLTSMLQDATIRASKYSNSDVKISKCVHQGNGTVLGTTVSALNNVIGSGFLVLPFSFFKATWSVGCASIIVMGIINCFTFWVVGVVGEGKASSLGGVWELLGGRKSSIIPDITILLNGMLNVMALMVVIGDFVPEGLPDIFGDPGPFSWNRFISTFGPAMCIILPLCYLQDFSKLRYMSTFGVFMMLYTVVFIIVDYAKNGFVVDHKQTAFQESPKSFNLGSMFETVAMYTSSYQCHYNAPAFYYELKGRSPQKFAQVAILTFGIVISVYLAVAFCGFCRFGGLVEDNILSSYRKVLGSKWGNDKQQFSMTWVDIAYIGIVINLVSAYPLCFQSISDAIFRVYLRCIQPEAEEAKRLKKLDRAFTTIIETGSPTGHVEGYTDTMASRDTDSDDECGRLLSNNSNRVTFNDDSFSSRVVTVSDGEVLNLDNREKNAKIMKESLKERSITLDSIPDVYFESQTIREFDRLLQEMSRSIKSKRKTELEEQVNLDFAKAEPLAFKLTTAFCVAVSAFVGWSGVNLSVVSIIRGSTVGVTICVGFPAVLLMFYCLRYGYSSKGPKRRKSGGKIFKRNRKVMFVTSWLLLLLSLSISMCGLTFFILRLSRVVRGRERPEMYKKLFMRHKKTLTSHEKELLTAGPSYHSSGTGTSRGPTPQQHIIDQHEVSFLAGHGDAMHHNINQPLLNRNKHIHAMLEHHLATRAHKRPEKHMRPLY